MYSDQVIAEADREVERLLDWVNRHKRPRGILCTCCKGFDLASAEMSILGSAYGYSKSKDRAASATHPDASLGRSTWAVACSQVKFGGYQRIYLRQLSNLGGMLLRSLEMRQYNASQEQALVEVRERAERIECQKNPSPWGESRCEGCGAKNRAWADTGRGMCARCLAPLASLPAL